MTAPFHVTLSAAEHDFRIRIYPAESPNGGMLVWLHGGAFMFGTLDMPEADQVGRRLSSTGTTVVSVEYTLAPLDALASMPPADSGEQMPTPEQMRAEAESAGPRGRFPIASLQIVAAFDWAVTNAARFGARPERVVLGGASAGGNLAAGTALRLRDRGTTAPSALALVYPVLHAPLPEADAELQSLLVGLPAFLAFPAEMTAAINRNYLGEETDENGYAFPGGHDVSGLPPTLIVNADRDRLRASGESFAAELTAAKVDVHVVRERDAVHGFLNTLGDPAAERTLTYLSDVTTGALFGTTGPPRA